MLVHGLAIDRGNPRSGTVEASISKERDSGYSGHEATAMPDKGYKDVGRVRRPAAIVQVIMLDNCLVGKVYRREPAIGSDGNDDKPDDVEQKSVTLSRCKT